MTWRQYLILALLGLGVVTLVAALQPSPGYMDADYYYAGGLQLAAGHGFTEPYLWNYLDTPAGIPHPSHAYWMPLASLLAAAGAALSHGSWWAARVGFLLVAACIPPVTGALAWTFTSRRDLAMASGLLAVFPAFYISFLPTTDTFGLYMLLGGLFFLILKRKPAAITPFLLGLLAGLMHLARADGLMWLGMAWLADLFIIQKHPGQKNTRQDWLRVIELLLLSLAGYLLVMGPWFLRNLAAFGTVLAPGGSKMLWLTSYDQLFAAPGVSINIGTWIKSGIVAILRVRLWALGLNLANAASVQAEIFLLPFIAVGLWYYRKDRVVQFALLAWGLTLMAMTVAFPFAGARGGFFHSGAAVQSMGWALAPAGLERVIIWASQKRHWDAKQAGKVFQAALVILAMLTTMIVIYVRVLGGLGGQPWDQERYAYRQINKYLVSQGMNDEDVLMVANPPGYYLISGNPAVAVPDGDLNALLGVAHRYNARYVILEEISTPGGLMPVYNQPENQPGLNYLGEVDGAQIYEIQP